MKNTFQKGWMTVYTGMAWFVVPFFMAFLMTMVPFQEPGERMALFLFAALLTGGISAYVYHKKIFENKSFMALFPLILLMAICLRLFLFPHESGDYNSFLRHWMNRMRILGWPLQIGVPFTNYNPLYTYILALLSHIPFSDLYLVKCASVVFDCVLGTTILFILKNCLKLKDYESLFGFSLSMIIPTVFLNSGMWAQCDSFYTSLLLIGLYLCLQNAPKKGCFFLGLALAAKLQAAIIFPILLFLIAYQRVYMRHLFLILLAYVLTIMPAVIAGRSIGDILNIYLNQIGSYEGLTMGAPTFWAIFPDSLYSKFLPLALGMASIVVFVFTFLTLLIKRIKEKTDYWDIAFLYALIIPYFLPKMHERYFYVATVLSIVYLLKYPKLWLLSVGVIFIDLCAYCPFLLGFSFVGIRWLSIVQLLIIIGAVWSLFKNEKEKLGEVQENQEEKREKSKIKWICLQGGRIVSGMIIILGSYWILNTPFNKNEGWRFNVQGRFAPVWVSEEDKIMTKHPSWEEKLVKLKNNKIMRASVGDIADIIVLNDKEMILRWGESNVERFVKNPETGMYQFQ